LFVDTIWLRRIADNRKKQEPNLHFWTSYHKNSNKVGIVKSAMKNISNLHFIIIIINIYEQYPNNALPER
jgi:hypothetical protein